MAFYLKSLALLSLALGLHVAVVLPDDQTLFPTSSLSFSVSQLQSSAVLNLDLWLVDREINLVFDQSYSEAVSYKIAAAASRTQVIYILAWDADLPSYKLAVKSSWPAETLFAATISSLKSVGLREILVVSASFEAVNQLSLEFDVQESVVLADSTPQKSLERLAMRVLKPTGVRSIILDLPSHLTKSMLAAMKKAGLLDKGYACFITPQTTWLDAKEYEGLLHLSDELNMAANSLFEYELAKLDYVLSKSKWKPGTSVQNLENAYAGLGLKLWNLLGPIKIEVGQFQGTTTILTGAILYPGNSLEFKPDDPIEIHIATFSSKNNPNGTIDTSNPNYFKGAFVALDEIIRTQILGRFNLISNEIQCGASQYIPAVQKMCLEKERNNLGLAIISSYSSGHTLGSLEAMKELGLKQPLVGSRTASSALSSTMKWPNFMRTIKTSGATVPAFVQFLLKHNYKRLNIFFSAEPYGQDYYNSMLPVLQYYGIEVVNPEVERALTPDFLVNRNNYTEKATTVLESGIRPTVFLALPPYRRAIIDLLFDSGVKAEDIVSLHAAQETSMWTEGTPQQIENRMTLLLNSFNFEHAGFIGTKGEEVRETIREAIGVAPNSGQCHFYDSAYLIVLGIKSMILKGLPYEDPTALGTEMRKTMFYGCTGKVAIDSDNNDRRDQDIDVFNVRHLESGYNGVLVSRFSFTSTRIFTQYAPIVWPGNSTVQPSLYRLNYEDCPFPEEYRQTFKEGEWLVVYLCVVYFFLACLVIISIYIKQYKREALVMINERVEISFNDRLIGFLMVVDVLQYIGHGPVLQTGQDIFSIVLDYASGGTLSAIKFTKGIYWAVLNSTLGIITLWVVCCMLIWLRIRKLEIRRLSFFSDFAEVVMPVLGNTLFLPITAILFDVFVCDEAHGLSEQDLNYKDSFMFRDCNEDCWIGSHLRYAMVCSVMLLAYLTVTVFTRPIWQELMGDLHVCTRKLFYLQKSFVEVTIVVIRRGVRKHFEVAHALIFLVVILGHLCLSFPVFPFNYARYNMWFRISMGIVMWYSIVAIQAKFLEFFTIQLTLLIFISVSLGLLGTL